jgi:hypothetical protein
MGRLIAGAFYLSTWLLAMIIAQRIEGALTPMAYAAAVGFGLLTGAYWTLTIGPKIQQILDRRHRQGEPS